MLLRKPRAWHEVYNDLDGEVVNLFRVLRDPARSRQLCRLLELTPHARAEFELAYVPAADPVEQARRTVVRGGMGVGTPGSSGRKTGFRAAVRSRGTNVAHDWATYPAQLTAFAQRLRGVVVENRPALELIRQQDAPEALFYADPPYPHSTRTNGAGSYRFEMGDNEHRELAATLRTVKGMVILSGYACDLYNLELYPDWHRVERETWGDCASARTEVLWINDAARKALDNDRPLFNTPEAAP